jgi:two-component system, NtrC family, sensor histidine kinase HydH
MEQKIERKILVVDDEPSGIEAVSEMLTLEGYVPQIFTQSTDALEAFEKDRFSLAFVDIKMPGIDGLALASRLKRMDSRLEVVFMTGYGTFDNAVEAIKIGAYDYLRKPFGLNEIRMCLRRFEERQSLIRRLEHSERRYSSLVQCLPSIIFAIGDDLRLEFVNRASQTVLGYTPQEATQDAGWLIRIAHPEDQARLKELLISALKSESARFSTECRLLHKDGYVVHVMMESIPPDDEFKGLRGQIIDISDRIVLERAKLYDENVRILGAISEELAHEIRNPLMAVGGFARRLKQKFPDLMEGEIILQESRRLENLLKRIVDYLRPKEFVCEEYGTEEILMECLELLGPEIEERGICLQLDLTPDLPPAYVDKDILAQAFTGLTLNMLEEMKSGTTLLVTGFQNLGNVNIRFSAHTGSHAKDDVAKVLMPFDEARQKTTLPLCSRLIRQMGGFLSFSREAQEINFTVSLPVKAG